MLYPKITTLDPKRLAFAFVWEAKNKTLHVSENVTTKTRI
jgi:hypothetical protein